MAAMAEVAEFRKSTRALLGRLDAGESIRVVVDDRPVVIRIPIQRRPSTPRAEFIERVLQHQADSGLASELREINPGTTADLP